MTDDVCCDLDVPVDSISNIDKFVDNVLIYISGFIMQKLIEKEKCTYCYTYLTECKERVSCQLINFKQLGGLMYPIFDVVTIVQIANRNMKIVMLFSNKSSLTQKLNIKKQRTVKYLHSAQASISGIIHM